jgi:bacillithiol system protein YtxJ
VVRRIEDEAALDEAFAAPAFLLLKHSSRCGVSTRAYTQFERFLEEGGEVPGAFIDVVADRRLSQRLAERSGIGHASPQAILLRDGAAVWNASHFDITLKSLSAAIRS